MKKAAVKTQKKEIKSVEKAKDNTGNRANLKKVGAAGVKKHVAVTELPPEQQSADTTTVPPSSETDVHQDNTEQVEVVAETGITEQPPEQKIVDTNSTKPQTESKVLRERLGLNGYCTETVKLSAPIEVLGCKAEGVVFARQIEGTPVDRILLHVTLISATGKRSIVSSRKKVPTEEWQALTDVLSSQAITWRDRELKRAAK